MKKLLLTFAFLVIVAAPSPFDPHSARLQDGEPITIEATAEKVPETYNNLGPLRLVAAARLSSKDVRFGGWSALEVKPDGDVLLLSDRAFILRGRLDLQSNGGVIGVKDARIGGVRDKDGEIAQKKRGDSEGLARLKNGMHVVSFELEPRLQFYDFDMLGETALPKDAPALARVDQLAPNAQLEAATVLSDGSILTGSERGFSGDDNAVLWRVPANAKPGAPAIEPLTTMPLPESFSLTELTAAPDGSIFALFRSYLPILGARAQIWRYTLVEKNGKTRIEGEKLASLEAPFPVDNYEGMAITSGPDGGLRLYIISDDNYRPEQRTILLAFDLKEKAPETGAPLKSK
jgi:hypothetical protein